MHLSASEVDELLSKRLIANLASINPDGSIHIVAMWFKREGDSLLLPTNSGTRKASNVRQRPTATVMIDQSRSGLDLCGVQISGVAELVDGPQARRLNRSIHERYITAAGLDHEAVHESLTAGDDVTVRVRMQTLKSWNFTKDDAAQALSNSGEFYPLDI